MFPTLMSLSLHSLFHSLSHVISYLFDVAVSLDLLLFAVLIAAAVLNATTVAVVSFSGVNYAVAVVFLPHFC